MASTFLQGINIKKFNGIEKIYSSFILGRAINSSVAMTYTTAMFENVAQNRLVCDRPCRLDLLPVLQTLTSFHSQQYPSYSGNPNRESTN